ncbi:peptide/nickel transport system substrate-binding protein [Albimonas donghaensis]|uniref:Peptide/nickel transport system substrate-binding protein n=1 Tax=Albimonas donghaensis TaxID=356660 RepID=A0A1H2QL35_9RHOB|nr:ABC transporter substrate-binding protein [Albimonas donghaensis]SDW07861.1 peptide/nickel transport system substrate-binding protein [Albimonas donghaensis]
MNFLSRLAVTGLAAAILAGPALAPAPAYAAPPADTFVMAKDVSDIITLDPAEVFEFSGGEIIAQIYDRLMWFEPEDMATLVCGVCETYTVSEDGKSITFTMREGMTFESGNPVTAEDVVYSLRRVVKLNKTPSFIITQFGWTPENVDELVRVEDGAAVITITEDFSPALVLNALSAGVASIVDMKTVEEHATDGDMGYAWLKNHSAGSGPFKLQTWKANELVSMTANEDFRSGAPGVKRVIVRHVAEPGAQRLLIEKGDIDVARDLTPDMVAALESNDDVTVQTDAKAAVIYMAFNQSDEILSNPKVAEAIRYLVDYRGMADTFLKGQFKVHQAAWPEGMWAAYNETPYALDIEKAKALLAEAGYPDGFEIHMDTLNQSPYPEIAQALQGTLAQAGIKVEISTAEGKTLWPMYRARKHQLILAQWSPDYTDPHSNLDAFAHNPDNSPEAKLTGVLAWRNAWMDEDMNAMVVAARNETDTAKREALYHDIQAKLMHEGPYAILFQQTEQAVMRAEVEGFVSGPTFDLIYYRTVSK